MRRAVEHFVAARRRRPAWDRVPDAIAPSTIAEGYRLQAAVHDRLVAQGASLRGYKIGSTSAAGQAAFGLTEPVYAGLFEQDRFASLTEALARPMTMPAIEIEIAFVLARATAKGASLPDLAAAVASCHISCEIIDRRYGEPLQDTVGSLLADDFFNVGFVLGTANPDWRARDLGGLDAAIRLDDTVHTANASSVLSALGVLAWLVQKLPPDRPLKPGDVVLTGSIVPPKAVSPHTRSIEMTIEGFEPLRFERS